MAYKLVKIGGKEVPMMAMASINIYYKRIFGRDPIKVQATKDYDLGDQINLYLEMGFVMAKFYELKADRKEMAKLNEDAYMDWLEQFEYADYMAAVPAITELYEGQSASTSQEKKEES